MDQTWQGKQSTKISTPVGNQPAFPPNFEHIDTMEPLSQEPFNTRTQIIFMTIIEITNSVFSDQLSQFPITFNRGKKYVVIFYIFDANFVKYVPIKNRMKEELLRAYKLVYAYLTARGFKPHLHKMEKETYHNVENFICK
jgi:hypothetical protein